MSEPAIMIDEDHYAMPAHGWTCFHCGETFKTPGSARDHFGFDPSCDPACRIKRGDERILVKAFRALEAKYQKLLEDTCDEQGKVAQEFYGLGAAHASKERRAEELGYSRGLRDARAERLDPTPPPPA